MYNKNTDLVSSFANVYIRIYLYNKLNTSFRLIGTLINQPLYRFLLVDLKTIVVFGGISPLS